jgi:HAD superfamily hydrolase (TIGR01549 family)
MLWTAVGERAAVLCFIDGNHMIRAIVFDFGQTLVDSADGFRTAEKEAQRKSCAALGPEAGEGFLEVYREIRSRFHARSDFSRKRILEAVFRHYGQEPDTALLEQWEAGYWERIKAMTRVFPEAEAVLTALRGRYRLALITNAQGQTEEGKHRLGNYPELKRFFEVILVAGEGGVPPKPDPLPFRLCLDQLGIAPDEAVYVGDDWRIDVCGSEAVGMHPVWLRHHSLRRNWPQVETAAPVIDGLERLLDIERLVPGGKK